MHRTPFEGADIVSARTAPQGRLAVQWVALLFGVVFLLAGIMGFIPGLTMNYEQMTTAGLQSDALLLGTFRVSVTHNLVHIIFGVAGLICWLNAAAARNYLRWGGVVYLLLWVAAFTVTARSADDVQLNVIGNWAWPAIAVAMFALSFLRILRPSSPGDRH